MHLNSIEFGAFTLRTYTRNQDNTAYLINKLINTKTSSESEWKLELFTQSMKQESSDLGEVSGVIVCYCLLYFFDMYQVFIYTVRSARVLPLCQLESTSYSVL
jgi:hypothetical protein